MAGHGSPAPEDRALHPGRQVSRPPTNVSSLGFQYIHNDFTDEEIQRPVKPGLRDKMLHDYEMGRLHEEDDD